jgi:signal transduction protein with GAF and PtsI domain
MIEHKRVESENQRLQTLIQAIGEAPDFPSALTITLGKICELTDWDYGEAWIPSKDDKFLEISPAWYASNRRGSDFVHALEQFRLCSEGFIWFPGIGLPGRVWSSQQPEWICDASAQTETYFLRNQIAKAFGVRAGLGVPILANHNVLAVLVFFMSEVRSEDRRLVELIVAAATQLGVKADTCEIGH